LTTDKATTKDVKMADSAKIPTAQQQAQQAEVPQEKPKVEAKPGPMGKVWKRDERGYSE